MENNNQQPEPTQNTKSNDLVHTGNSLADIIAWLKLGHTIIIHAEGYGKMYRMPDLKAIRKIYVDVSSFPSLLHEGEWPWYIKDAGAREIFNDDTFCYEETKIVSFSILH